MGRGTTVVSVIMPAYNAASTIGESISSVFAQTFTDWELIIVDDCSQDDTIKVAEAIIGADDRVSIIRREQNEGVASARNLGMKAAKGEWLAFLDSDDLWKDVKLERQLAFARENNAVITYTSTSYMDYKGRELGYILGAKPLFTYKQLLKRNLLSCSSVVVLRDRMPDFPSGNMHEDYAVWLGILKDNNAYGLEEPLLVYRIGRDSKSAKRMNSAVMTYNAYKYVGYGSFMAFLLTIQYSKHSILKRISIWLWDFVAEYV